MSQTLVVRGGWQLVRFFPIVIHSKKKTSSYNFPRIVPLSMICIATSRSFNIFFNHFFIQSSHDRWVLLLSLLLGCDCCCCWRWQPRKERMKKTFSAGVFDTEAIIPSAGKRWIEPREPTSSPLALLVLVRVICIYRVGAELFGGVRGLSELMSCSVTSLTNPGGCVPPLSSFSLNRSLSFQAESKKMKAFILQPFSHL